MREQIKHAALAFLALTAMAGRAEFLFDIDVGAAAENAHFGFGWWRPEQDRERSFRWIRFHLEADCWLELSDPTSFTEIEIHAAPYYHPRRAQRLALYINDRFVAEWRFPHRQDWTFHPLRARIPRNGLQKGANRLVLRAGYVGERGYAVAIDRIRLLAISETTPR